VPGYGESGHDLPPLTGPAPAPEKKSLIASERDEQARKQFRKITGTFAINKYVFIDEMGTNLELPRLYGRAAPGTRVLEQVPGDRGGNVSTIGAIALDGMRTGLSVPGAIDGETLLFFVEELLVPTLKRGDIVVMDNNPTHKLDEIEEAIEAAGAWVLFLPTYSPDLNPIENCWSKVKAHLRSLKPRTLPDLLDALVTAFASVTEHDIRGWVEHCGYRVAPT
jgi:transposase